MEEISVLQKSRIAAENRFRTNLTGINPSGEIAKKNEVIDKLMDEGGENFVDYLDWHGLANDPNLLVLSSKLHYYYDPEELKSVKTLINVKRLNLIKHLDDFFNIVNTVLNPKANFIGCFSDRKSDRGTSLSSKMFSRILNFLDSKFDIDIDKKDISRLLESHGFKIIDMTEINGLIYFRSQINRRAVN